MPDRFGAAGSNRVAEGAATAAVTTIFLVRTWWSVPEKPARLLTAEADRFTRVDGTVRTSDAVRNGIDCAEPSARAGRQIGPCGSSATSSSGSDPVARQLGAIAR
jgi:hypothetical protein